MMMRLLPLFEQITDDDDDDFDNAIEIILVIVITNGLTVSEWLTEDG